MAVVNLNMKHRCDVDDRSQNDKYLLCRPINLICSVAAPWFAAHVFPCVGSNGEVGAERLLNQHELQFSILIRH